MEATRCKTNEVGVSNVRVERRDFVANGTGLADASVDTAMVFNILHGVQPELLLREAWGILSPDVRLGVGHWSCDPSTPSGLSMGIRPEPEQCRDWAVNVGFGIAVTDEIDLPPYHYGSVMEKR